MSYQQINTCRFCKTDSTQDTLYKYGVRHYVCCDCGIKHWGAEFLDKIPAYELKHLPFFRIRDAGLLPELEKRIGK